MSEPAPILESSRLAIGYPDRKSGKKRVAEQLNLKLQRGKLVCLLGPNGTGKSTLIRTLAGLQPKLDGEVFLEGVPLGDVSPRNRAKKISLVLTDFVPMGIFSVYSLVALGRHPHTRWNGTLSDEDHRKIEWAIKAARAESLTQRNISELSDGERQKVMIARALAQEAPVLLLDEPTAYLDLVRQIELMHTLRDLAHSQEMAILQSTHNLELAMQFSDELWLLSEEGVIVRGTPESLALDGKLNMLFGNHELKWDSEHGSFHIHKEPSRFVHLEGIGPELLWTKRTLLRHGYGLASERANACLIIRISGSGTSARWQIESLHQEFESLEAFTSWLGNYKK